MPIKNHTPSTLTLGNVLNDIVQFSFLPHYSVPQQSSQLCWAACIECIELMETSDASTQLELADRFVADCHIQDGVMSPRCDARISRRRISDIWEALGYRNVTSPRQQLETNQYADLIEAELSAGRLVQIEEEGAHVVVAAGFRKYRTQYGENRQFFLMDPQAERTRTFRCSDPRGSWHYAEMRPRWTGLWSNLTKKDA